MLTQVKTFPYLKDKAIYLAIKLSTARKPKLTQYSLVEIPTGVVGARFVSLPSNSDKRYIILLDDIIRYNLPEVFSCSGLTI